MLDLSFLGSVVLCLKEFLKFYSSTRGGRDNKCVNFPCRNKGKCVIKLKVFLNM